MEGHLNLSFPLLWWEARPSSLVFLACSPCPLLLPLHLYLSWACPLPCNPCHMSVPAPQTPYFPNPLLHPAACPFTPCPMLVPDLDLCVSLLPPHICLSLHPLLPSLYLCLPPTQWSPTPTSPYLLLHLYSSKAVSSSSSSTSPAWPGQGKVTAAPALAGPGLQGLEPEQKIRGKGAGYTGNRGWEGHAQAQGQEKWGTSCRFPHHLMVSTTILPSASPLSLPNEPFQPGAGSRLALVLTPGCCLPWAGTQIQESFFFLHVVWEKILVFRFEWIWYIYLPCVRYVKRESTRLLAK